MLIALEGIDASGKHTQTEKLKEHYESVILEDMTFNVTKFDFPHYNSITGEMILGHLMGDWKVDLSEKAKSADHKPLYHTDASTYLFQCCQLVNRMECLPDAVWERRPNDVFVFDRYNASAYAYGIAFGLDFDWLVKTHRHLPQPDINIFLDITVEESVKRRPERRDEYEKNLDMLKNVRRCYLEVFDRLGPSYVVIDASGTKEETFSKILNVIQAVQKRS